MKKEPVTQKTSQVTTETKAKELPVLTVGEEFAISIRTGGEVKLLFKEVNKIKLPDGTYNLVLKIQIKNNATKEFFIDDTQWKLVNPDMIEISESGVYDFDLEIFDLGTFFMTSVEAGFGKIEEVGYQLNQGTYYLCILGEPFVQIKI